MENVTKRTALLKAACQLVREKGAATLTLDAVAKEAGVSKGGLLYHFPSKDALIKALMEDFLDRFDKETELESATNAELTNNRWAQAFLIKTVQLTKEDLEMNAAVMAAAAMNPDLLQPIKDRYETWQQRIETTEADPVAATVIRLAADGLFFSELFGFAPLSESMKAAVLKYMMAPAIKEEN